jgi:hypothetical protein
VSVATASQNFSALVFSDAFLRSLKAGGIKGSVGVSSTVMSHIASGLKHTWETYGSKESPAPAAAYSGMTQPASAAWHCGTATLTIKQS